jgi:hypothetical protein
VQARRAWLRTKPASEIGLGLLTTGLFDILFLAGNGMPIPYIYRVLVQRQGHRLHLDTPVDQGPDVQCCTAPRHPAYQLLDYIASIRPPGLRGYSLRDATPSVALQTSTKQGARAGFEPDDARLSPDPPMMLVV